MNMLMHDENYLTDSTYNFKSSVCNILNPILGLRCIKPYYFTFTTHAKGRWVGKQLIDIFKSEFKSNPVEYYVRMISHQFDTLLACQH